MRSIAILAATWIVCTGLAHGAEHAPGWGCGGPPDLQDGWTVTAPEAQSVTPTVLCEMGDGVAAGHLPEVDSILVVRHGVLVYERYFNRPHTLSYDAATRHVGNSMTKSVVSLLLGIAVDRGLIKDLDAPVLSFFPEFADLRTPEKERITLRHLLTMTAGLNASVSAQMLSRDHDPDRHAFEQALAREPGAAFEYSNLDTEIIGAILEKVTGKPLDVFAIDELFGPLGITDVDWYRRLGNQRAMSSNGLSLRPRDWAKLGQLVLNRGAWDGKQLVSASWIAQSTSPQVSAPKSFSYGFQWWLGHSAVRDHTVAWTAALGFNAQKLIVIPEYDTIVVFHASRESVQMVTPEIELLNRYILPALL
ncbi:beta-lactamase family protein [Bradyrhizobium ontarionense]|uniref:Beta-lactamase family protein n=1 Tax=Bradyrhizobium ontarionense TaxID=2898149 RepID=A0ABY3R8A0_9BRAD|nr:serine hydrolase [Bradyrhizobium sp. A19]UFZ03272.1 beta-lactamase family protein [Bradyrhizobium sp. A19]